MSKENNKVYENFLKVMSHDTEDYQNGINGSRRNPLSVQDRRILEEMAGGNYFEYLMKGEYQSFVFRLRRVRYWIVKVIIMDELIESIFFISYAINEQ